MATLTNQHTVNVVPAGYKWTEKDAQKAAEEHNFIRVGGKNVTRRVITGAGGTWRKTNPKDHNAIYITDEYRITGTEEDIRTALSAAGVSAATINALIANAITRDNWNRDAAGEYEAEKRAYEAYKDAKERTRQEAISNNDILWFAQNLKSATVVRKQRATARAGARSPGRGRARKTLREKEEAAAAAGKVLDVSKITADGKQVRTVVRPAAGSRSKKVGLAEPAIISDNEPAYALALGQLYGPDADVAHLLDAFHAELAARLAPKPKASPVRRGRTAAVPPVRGAVAGTRPSPRAVVPRRASPTRVSPTRRSPTRAAVPRVASPGTTTRRSPPAGVPRPPIRRASPTATVGRRFANIPRA